VLCQIFIYVLVNSLIFRHVFIHYFFHDLSSFTFHLTFLISCPFSSRREVIALLNMLVVQCRPTKCISVKWNLIFHCISTYMFRTRRPIFRKTFVTSRHILHRTFTCYYCLPEDEVSVSKYVHVGDTVKNYIKVTEVQFVGLLYTITSQYTAQIA
jgi:hypothetical protein